MFVLRIINKWSLYEGKSQIYKEDMLIVMHLQACAQIYDFANALHDEKYVYK